MFDLIGWFSLYSERVLVSEPQIETTKYILCLGFKKRNETEEREIKKYLAN